MGKGSVVDWGPEVGKGSVVDWGPEVGGVSG